MPTMLVTGAASGIGRALLDRGLKRGDRMIAADIDTAGLASLGSSANLLPLRMDVSSTESVAAGFAEVDRWLAGAPLQAVVNCAAWCPLGVLEVQPIEVIERVLNINAIGSARILREAVPRLRGHDGRIALITSLWGKVAGPMLSAYCASKHAVEALADTMRRETHGQGVSIIVIEPGVVRTPLVKRQIEEAKQASAQLPEVHRPRYGSLYAKYAALIEKSSTGGVSSDECAAAIEKAVFARKPSRRYRVGSDSKAITALARLLPDSALDSMFKAMLK